MLDVVLTLAFGVLSFFLGLFLGSNLERKLLLLLKRGHYVTLGVDNDIEMTYMEGTKVIKHKLHLQELEPPPENETAH